MVMWPMTSYDRTAQVVNQINLDINISKTVKDRDSVPIGYTFTRWLDVT